MISVSLAASCFKMANISSCLRMALAFSTPASSAKLSSSVGVLTLRSWSFISLTMSCMGKLLRKGLALRRWENGKRRARRGGVRKFIPEIVLALGGACASHEDPARAPSAAADGDESLYSRSAAKGKEPQARLPPQHGVSPPGQARPCRQRTKQARGKGARACGLISQVQTSCLHLDRRRQPIAGSPVDGRCERPPGALPW